MFNSPLQTLTGSI